MAIQRNRLPKAPRIPPNAIAEALERECADIVEAKGEVTEADIAGMLKRGYDKQTRSFDKAHAEALNYIGEAFRTKMSSGAKKLFTEFQAAYYMDMMVSETAEEAQRQWSEQFKLDNKLFEDFMKRDKAQHKAMTYEEFKQDLKENRIETSEWQSMQLWLQTGVKKNPITD